MEAVTGASAAAAEDVVEAAGRRESVRRPRRYILPSERSLRDTSRESPHRSCHFKEIGKVYLYSFLVFLLSYFMHLFARAKCKHVLRLREVRGAMKNTASQHSFHLILSKILTFSN